MHTSRTRPVLVLAIGLCVAGVSFPAAAEGEPDGAFPSWEERWIHQLINRARCDPQVEMAACGANCAVDELCYSPVAPLPWASNLNRAARFHGANLTSSGCGMQHYSPCTLLTNIGDLYPEPCDGDVSCACETGTIICGSMATTPFGTRISYFGASPRGEIIAPMLDPTSTFYLWLYEPASNPACAFTVDKGHRWLILTEDGAVGIGADEDYCTGDFGSGSLQTKIPSGSHYPRQAATVEAWANWYDTAGPAAAAVNVGGVCNTMSLERGTATNGAWMAEVAGVGSGCHRYYFEFLDSVGTCATYPTTGSLAIGAGAGCPDWDASRPSSCLIAPNQIFADGFESGTTGLWSATVPQ